MPTPRPASSTTWTEQWATAHFTSLYHHTTPQHTKPLCEGTYFFSDNSALRLYHTTNCAVPFSYFTIIATSNS